MAELIRAKGPDGAELMINLDLMAYASFQGGERPELYFYFGRDSYYTLEEEEAERVWRVLQRKDSSGPFG